MIPVQLSLRNFLSYGEMPVSLDFSPFHVACLTGDNGHGKSALLDAITYALWGQARKGRSDRKPDEGLLRLGAQEMQVEFTFEVDDRRFRVLRSFRQRRRTSASQLELQAWDPGAGVFHPLSDRAAISHTQARIDQLLAMDYDTFINSAFILQGRADEFTRRSARERKDILGEILGLSRYDRLQESARRHLVANEREMAALERRRGDVDAELAEKPEWESRRAELEAELTGLAAHLARGEADLDEASRRLTEVAARRRRLLELAEEASRLEAARAELDDRCQRLEGELERHAAVVARAPQIEARQTQHDAASSEAASLNAALAQARQLELKISELESRVREARHRVAAELVALDSRRQEVEAQVTQAQGLVDREAEIAAAHQRLEAALEREQALLEAQERHQAMSRRRLDLEHEIQVEAHRLEERRLLLEQRRAELAMAVEARPALLEETARCEARLQEARQAADRLEALRQIGTRLRARVGELEAQQSRLERERQRLEDRVRVLAESGAAACPLCGSRLDGPHRARLDRELADEAERCDREVEAVAGQRHQAAEELDGLRREYRSLEPAADCLETTRDELTRLRSQLAHLDEQSKNATQLAAESAAVGAALEAGEYATQARAALVQVEADEAQLAFDPGALVEVRGELEALDEARTLWAQLQDARLRLGRARDLVAELDQRRAALQETERSGGAAAAEAEQLEQLRSRARAVAYDAARHDQVRAHLEDLADAPGEYSCLQEARLRQAGVREALDRLAQDAASLERRLGEVRSAAQRLQREGADDEEVAARAEALRREVADGRNRREQLLEEVGSVRARCERLGSLEGQRRDLAGQLQQVQRQAWVHRHLVQAFGKDGIQALVIEGAIPEIEDEANHLLRRLTDNRIQISIESLRDLKGGGTRETLDIQIADELGPRSYSMYSGGEAFRTDFALRIALSKVLARRAGTQLRTLIIDEGFGTQDSRGLEQLRDAIQEISQDFDKLLVVTHLPELKDAFPVQIEVSKDPEQGSQLRVIDLR